MFALVERRGLAAVVVCLGLSSATSVACGSRSTLGVGETSLTTEASSGRGGASAGSASVAAGGKASAGASATATGGSATTTGGATGLPKPPVSFNPPTPEGSPPELCSIDHWCGANADFVAIWGSAPGDIWIVANYSGDLENQAPSPYPTNRSALLHWDGMTWTASQFAEAGQIHSISGSAADDVWVVGDDSFIAHYDGSVWTTMAAPVDGVSLASVAVAKRNDVWAVGPRPSTVLHFDGKAWTQVDVPRGDYTAVWASGDVVWLPSPDIRRKYPPSGPIHFGPWWSEVNSIWGRSASSAIGVGTGFIENSALPSANCIDRDVDKRTFRGLWGFGENDIWVVGDGGAVLHWDGTSCAAGPRATEATLNAAWGFGQTLWIVGNDGAFLEAQSTDGRISVKSSLNSLRVSHLWGSAPDDVWALGHDALHWDGRSWTQVAWPSRSDVFAVWGSGSADVWAIHQFEPSLHWDGTAWRDAGLPAGMVLTGIWGSAPNDVWAVGTIGDLLHFDGTAWRVERRLGDHLSAVWGNSATDVIAVGGAQRFHFDGSSWSLLPPRAGEQPEYRVAFGDAGVWMAGEIASSPFESKLSLSRWNGQMLNDSLGPNGTNGQPTLPTKAVPTAGWAGAEDDVWLALPQVLHWDGEAWHNTAVSGHWDSSASALWGTAKDLWAITGTGQIMRRRR